MELSSAIKTISFYPSRGSQLEKKKKILKKPTQFQHTVSVPFLDTHEKILASEEQQTTYKQNHEGEKIK